MGRFSLGAATSENGNRKYCPPRERERNESSIGPSAPSVLYFADAFHPEARRARGAARRGGTRRRSAPAKSTPEKDAYPLVNLTTGKQYSRDALGYARALQGSAPGNDDLSPELPLMSSGQLAGPRTIRHIYFRLAAIIAPSLTHQYFFSRRYIVCLAVDVSSRATTGWPRKSYLSPLFIRHAMR